MFYWPKYQKTKNNVIDTLTNKQLLILFLQLSSTAISNVSASISDTNHNKDIDRRSWREKQNELRLQELALEYADEAKQAKFLSKFNEYPVNRNNDGGIGSMFTKRSAQVAPMHWALQKPPLPTAGKTNNAPYFNKSSMSSNSQQNTNNENRGTMSKQERKQMRSLLRKEGMLPDNNTNKKEPRKNNKGGRTGKRAALKGKGKNSQSENIPSSNNQQDPSYPQSVSHLLKKPEVPVGASSYNQIQEMPLSNVVGGQENNNSPSSNSYLELLEEFNLGINDESNGINSLEGQSEHAHSEEKEKHNDDLKFLKPPNINSNNEQIGSDNTDVILNPNFNFDDFDLDNISDLTSQIEKLQYKLEKFDNMPELENDLIPVTEANSISDEGQGKDPIPSEWAFLTNGDYYLKNTERKEKLQEEYAQKEQYFSDPNTFGVSLGDKEHPHKLKFEGPFYRSNGHGNTYISPPSGRQRNPQANANLINPIPTEDMEIIEEGVSPAGCRYSETPEFDSRGKKVNGVFDCDEDYCTIRCNPNYAWSESGRGTKKIRCDKKGALSTWQPMAGFAEIPTCTSRCPALNPTILNEILPKKDDGDTVDVKDSLFCNKFGGEACTPGINCHHTDQCYIKCPANYNYDVTPYKNTITCDCTGLKCKWVDQGGPRGLRKTSICVKDLYHARIIGGNKGERGDDSSLMISFGVFGSSQKTNKRVWQHMCGGVLLNSGWGFTAAHCKKAQLRAVIGEYRLNVKEGSEVNCKVLMQIRHPLYDGGTHNDIMMTNLKCKKLVMGDMITPALLPRPGMEAPDGLGCRICGWGNTAYPDYKPAETLQCVDLPIIEQKECNKPYANSIHDDIFCIGEMGKEGKDSCQGDSGGPALCGGIVYGLVMGGLYCAHPDYPGVYTKTSHYIHWARNVIGAIQSRKSLYKRRSKRSLHPPKNIRKIELNKFL